MDEYHYPLSKYEPPPEEMLPIQNDYVLVGLTWHGEFNYYVAPKYIWYLDMFKGPPEDGVEYHLGIYTVDEAHEEEYIRRLEPFKRSVERLRDELGMCITDGERRGYYPYVLIDFDRRHVRDYLGDYWIKDRVPDGWTGEFKEVKDEDFPPDKRYWIDENGNDMIWGNNE